MLADGVTVKLGNQMWAIGLNRIVCLIVAAIAGFAAESLVGWVLPPGMVGAIFAALVGARLLTKVLVEQQMLEWPGAMTTLERRNLLEHEVLEVPGMRVVSRIPRFPRGPVQVFIQESPVER